MHIIFDWDPAKALRNLRKHGVSFELASDVFRDPLALSLLDSDSSEQEDERWVTLGQVNGQYYVVVVHNWSEEGSDGILVRIISARPATRHEIRQYQQR